MSSDRKVRAVGLTLLLVGIWPLGQFLLARSLDVSPWKLGGWGMYSTPQDNIGISLARVDPATTTLVPVARNRLPEEFWRETIRFAQRRWVLGRLARPDRVGRRALDLMPDLDDVTVVVSRLYVDRRTATVKLEQIPYSYSR